jgi:hypothetical protein
VSEHTADTGYFKWLWINRRKLVRNNLMEVVWLLGFLALTIVHAVQGVVRGVVAAGGLFVAWAAWCGVCAAWLRRSHKGSSEQDK